MLKLIDKVFSLNTKKEKDMNAFASFIYNFYEEKETTVDDSKIITSDFSYRKKRFIRLSFKNLNESDRFDYNTENFVQSIYELSLKKNLDFNNIKKFNKLDKIVPKRRFIINNLDEEEKNTITAFYREDTNSSFANDIMYSYRMSYLNPDLFNNSLDRINLISDFPEEGMSEQNSVYQDIILKGDVNLESLRDQTQNLTSNSNGCHFSDLVPLEKKVNEINSYELDFSKYNGIRCGLLLEKFILENDDYNFVCARFFTKSQNQDQLYLSSVIEDEAVKYGKTYRYVAYNVYLYSELDANDKCILNKYLICDHPYIFKDIECIESEPPPPPRNLKFFQVDNFNLKISWQEPSDYQYDAKGYQILKRNSLDEPFKVIKQLEGHKNSDLYIPEESVTNSLIQKTPGEVKYTYIDNSYEKGKITIYAVRTIDAHGYFSNYSEQIAIVYDPFEDKIIYDLVSHSGASRNYPNEKLLNKSLFFDYDDKIVDNLPVVKNPKSISLYITPDYSQIKTVGENLHSVFDNGDKFKFTIFRLNDLKKYEKKFMIKNFKSQ